MRGTSSRTLDLEMADLFDEEPTRETKMLVAKYDYVDGYTGEVAFYKNALLPQDVPHRALRHCRQGSLRIPRGRQAVAVSTHQSCKAGMDAGEIIWVVEGEADVHSIEKMGGVATTQPHGAGPGKWTDFHTHLLRRAKAVRIVVDIDADQAERLQYRPRLRREDSGFLDASGNPRHAMEVTRWQGRYGRPESG